MNSIDWSVVLRIIILGLFLCSLIATSIYYSIKVKDPKSKHFEKKLGRSGALVFLIQDFIRWFDRNDKIIKKIIETPRLYLREFTLEDTQNLVDLNSDPRVTRYTENEPILTIADAHKKLTTDILLQYPNKLGRLAVHLKSNDEFIGWCGIKYSKKDDAITLGYRFFHKHWGKGYATEAAKASLEYGVNVLKLKSIIAKVAKENVASINVIKKLGMMYLKDDLCAHDEAEVYILK